jgi:hypothetical protein
MSGKATLVFWLGLILIVANWWISGQSSTFWSAVSRTGNASSSAVTGSILGLGLELAGLGVAAGVASINDDVGNIMITFMGGLFLLFMIHHTAFTQAIPKLFSMVPSTATS